MTKECVLCTRGVCNCIPSIRLHIESVTVGILCSVAVVMSVPPGEDLVCGVRAANGIKREVGTCRGRVVRDWGS